MKKREWDDRAWFDMYRPGSVEAAKSYFSKQIERQTERLCGGKSLEQFEKFTVRGGLEDTFGDLNQSSLENIAWLGDFDFYLNSSNFHFQREGNRVVYTGEMLLVDIYGNQHHYWDELFPRAAAGFANGLWDGIAGPERKVLLGRWPINGEVNCCKFRLLQLEGSPKFQLR